MKCTMVESPDSFSGLTNPPYLQLSWSKRPSQRNCPFSSQILLTSSSHVFHESWIYELFSRNFKFRFLEGCQVSFSVMMNSYVVIWSVIFDRNLPWRKTKKENFVKKIHRFVDSGIVKTCDELDLSLVFSVCRSK